MTFRADAPRLRTLVEDLRASRSSDRGALRTKARALVDVLWRTRTTDVARRNAVSWVLEQLVARRQCKE